jgi:hypothetical protein
MKRNLQKIKQFYEPKQLVILEPAAGSGRSYLALRYTVMLAEPVGFW